MKTIQKYSNLFSVDGNIDDIRNNLPDDWIKSSITGVMNYIIVLVEVVNILFIVEMQQ